MNYMDYVDDKVMVMFSNGQLDRMNDALSGPRAALAQSKGLVPVCTERVALEDEPLSLAAVFSGDAETGDRTELVFDGVSWVSGT